MGQIIQEIKPCPFCGRIWMSVEPHAKNNFAVQCRCGASGPKERTKNGAILSWNTRDQHLLWNPFRLSIRFPKNISAVDFKGNLQSIDLATILQTLSTARKTGILQVVQGYIKSVICLKEGNIVAASDSNGLRLGQILYKHGMVSNKRLRESLQVARKSDKMLGEVLLDMGYIDIDTLKEVIHQQVQEAVLDLFFWKTGYFEYRDCIVEFDEEGAQGINTMEIIMESMRRMDEWDELKKRKEGQSVMIEPPILKPVRNKLSRITQKKQQKEKHRRVIELKPEKNPDPASVKQEKGFPRLVSIPGKKKNPSQTGGL